MLNHRCYSALLSVLVLLGMIACLPDSNALAQQDLSDKKSLEHSDYDLWHRISNQQICNDGKWILYSSRSGKVDADSVLKVRETGTAKEYSIDRAGGARFTYDSKYVIYRISPSQAKLKALRKAKSKETPSPILEVLELKTGEKFSTEGVSSCLLYTSPSPRDRG